MGGSKKKAIISPKTMESSSAMCPASQYTMTRKPFNSHSGRDSRISDISGLLDQGDTHQLDQELTKADLRLAGCGYWSAAGPHRDAGSVITRVFGLDAFDGGGPGHALVSLQHAGAWERKGEVWMEEM